MRSRQLLSVCVQLGFVAAVVHNHVEDTSAEEHTADDEADDLAGGAPQLIDGD